MLVDADWVQVHLGDPACWPGRQDTTAYHKGHIGGAVKIGWKEDLRDLVRRDFVSRSGFRPAVERGIGSDDTVILYGGNNNWFAAYAYWYFKSMGTATSGCSTAAARKWELDSRELVTDLVYLHPTSYRAQEPDSSIRLPRRGDRAIGQLNLVDVRSPDGFAGRLLPPRAPAAGAGAARRAHPGREERAMVKAAADDGTFRTMTSCGGCIGATRSWTSARTPSLPDRRPARRTWFVHSLGLPRETMTGRGPNTAPSSACNGRGLIVSWPADDPRSRSPGE